MNAAQTKWIKTIHVAKRDLQLSNEQYEAILTGAAGCTTSKDIKNWQQYTAVMNAFKTLGFTLAKPRSIPPVSGTVRSAEHISARQEYYIKGLWLLASRKKDEKSLRALVKRIGGVDDITFLPRKKAASVIQALRDIAEKAGFNPDQPPENRS